MQHLARHLVLTLCWSAAAVCWADLDLTNRLTEDPESSDVANLFGTSYEGAGTAESGTFSLKVGTKQGPDFDNFTATPFARLLASIASFEDLALSLPAPLEWSIKHDNSAEFALIFSRIDLDHEKAGDSNLMSLRNELENGDQFDLQNGDWVIAARSAIVGSEQSDGLNAATPLLLLNLNADSNGRRASTANAPSDSSFFRGAAVWIAAVPQAGTWVLGSISIAIAITVCRIAMGCPGGSMD